MGRAAVRAQLGNLYPISSHRYDLATRHAVKDLTAVIPEITNAHRCHEVEVSPVRQA
jgi:hypothetical protein